MGKIYYLFSITFVFFSLQHAFSQVGCSDLEITAVEGGTVCGGGSVVLRATSSGTGDDIFWYDAATGGDVVGQGNVFETPAISATTSYWAVEAIASGSTGTVGPVDPSMGTATGSSIAIGTQRMYFDVHQPVVLASVDIYPTATVGSQGSVTIRDNNQQVLYDIPYTTTVTGGTTPQTIMLNVSLQPGSDYEIGQGTAISLMRNSNGAVFPYSSPMITLTDTSFNTGYYYWFYNWVYDDLVIDCESPREEVVATVNDAADEDVVSIPYSHSGNTEDYYNNYTGIPGVDCGSVDNYLDGYDVVYKYTADDDYVLTVSLDSISEQYSAVFVYESCADIGVSCAEEGSVAEDSIASHGFDMLVEEGESYYFVVSSAEPTESFDYILNINGYGCNDIPAPTTADASPYFMTGDNLSSLENYVDALRLSQGIKWYSDSSLTTEITDPDNEILVDGVSYYVTQEVIGCEGDALEFTPIEFDCSVLSPDIINEVVELCVPGGYAKFEAETSAAGQRLLWYESATSKEPIAKGKWLDLGYVNESTSYWVTEARLVNEVLTEQAEIDPPALSNSVSTNSGLQFEVKEAFTLSSVTVLSTAAAGGQIQVDIRDINAGNDVVFSTTVSIPGGGTTTNPIPVVVPIDFELEEGFYRILRVTSGTTVGLGYMTAANSSFPYTLGDDVGEIFTGSSLSGNSTLYYFFFDWIIEASEVMCESDRVEVQVIVSDDIPEAPEVERNYTFCGMATYTLADIEVEGEELVWYDRVGNELEEDTEVEDGKTYYVVDKSGGCVSEIAEVSISVREYSDIPEGEEEQNFVEGETLADLDVNGVQLKWYADIDKEEPLDIDTKLEDKATYYVSQTKSGHCESEALGVTVTLVLGVDNFNFESFEYFPNPVENQMTLQNEKEIQSVEVYDMQGRAVIMQNNIHKNIVNIDFENISTGNYLMKVFVKDSMRTVHIIKK